MPQDNSLSARRLWSTLAGIWFAGVLVFIAWQGSRPLYQLDQFNLGDADVVASVPADASLRQTILPATANLDALYLRTATALAEHRLVLALEQAGQELYRAEHQLKLELAVDDQRFVDPQGRTVTGAWLTTALPRIALTADEPLTLVLTPSDAPLQLAWQKDRASYPAGRLQLAGEARPGSIGFATFEQRPATAALGHSLFVEHQFFWLVVWTWLVVACGVGAQLIGRRQLPWVALVCLLALTYTIPLYQNMTAGGLWDWPEAAAAYQSAEHSLGAGQFPGWNPYICGGVPSWADPQPYWPSATFLLTILAGPVAGSKLATTLYLSFGLIGLALLAQRLGLSRVASLLSATLFIFSGFVAAHLVAGQMLWLTVAYVPWVLYCFVRSEDSRWWLVPSALAFAAILFEGRVYLNAYLVLWLPLLASGLVWQRRRWAPLVSLLLWFGLAAGLSAVKLLPTLAFSRDLSGSLSEETGIPWNRLLEVLTTRTVELMSYQPDWLPLAWHEVAAYIGWPAVGLAAMGVGLAFWQRDKTWLPWIVGLVLFGSVAIAQTPDYNILEYLPLARELHNPGRAISMLVLALALLAGFGFDWLLSRIRHPRVAVLIGMFIVVGLFTDLALMAAGPLRQLYSQPLEAYTSDALFRQVDGHADNGLHIVTAGYGAIDYCPPHNRKWRQDAAVERAGGNFVSSEHGTAATLTSFTPNELRVTLGEVLQEDRVIINQKYDIGWRSEDAVIVSASGRLAAVVTPAQANTEPTLRYRVPYLRLGGALTLATILLIAGLYWRHGKT